MDGRFEFWVTLAAPQLFNTLSKVIIYSPTSEPRRFTRGCYLISTTYTCGSVKQGHTFSWGPLDIYKCTQGEILLDIYKIVIAMLEDKPCCRNASAQRREHSAYKQAKQAHKIVFVQSPEGNLCGSTR